MDWIEGFLALARKKTDANVVAVAFKSKPAFFRTTWNNNAVVDPCRYGGKREVGTTVKDSFDIAANDVDELAEGIDDFILLRLAWLHAEHSLGHCAGVLGGTLDRDSAFPVACNLDTSHHGYLRFCLPRALHFDAFDCGSNHGLPDGDHYGIKLMGEVIH